MTFAASRFFALIFYILLLQPLVVAAQDFISERSYLEDPGNLLQLQDVQAADAVNRFTPFAGILNRGYSASAFWIKLKIQPSEQLILRIRPNYLDEVALYDPLAADLGPRFVGDRHALGQAPYRSLNHNLVIPGSSQERVIWLRLKTSSSSLINVEARSFSETISLDRHQDLLSGVFIGALLMFLAGAVIHWRMYKEPVVGALAINQLVALLFSLSVLGYFRLALTDYVPAVWIDQATSVLALMAATTALYFNMLFLREFKPSALGLRILLGLMCLLPLELLLLWAGQVRIAMQVNVLLVMGMPFIFFLLALTGKAWDHPTLQPTPLFSKRVLLWFYGVTVCTVALFALPMLGWVGSTEIALQTNSLGGFFTGLMLIATLHFRARRIMQTHHEDQLSLSLAQAQVDQERQQRRAQSQLMSMLTHELKTPLSEIRMVVGLSTQPQEIKMRADRAVQDMTAVIDRCAWTERLEEGGYTLTQVAMDIVHELEQLVLQNSNPSRVTLNLPPTACERVTDPQAFRMILGNLIENALKYSPAESMVDVQVEARTFNQQPGFCMSVVNLPGPAGWPDSVQVFEKYYRSPGAHRQTGSGLGLYLAATLARQLGGHLRYASDEKFVRFEFCLPA